jgi:hypothetical protein
MTYLSPAGGAASPPPSTLSWRTSIRPAPAQPALPHPLDRRVLTLKIACRCARLAELEAEMIAACEAAALGYPPWASATPKRGHWDRTTWHRYLATAMRMEAAYGPRMRRLRQEIGQLERLMDLRIAA